MTIRIVTPDRVIGPGVLPTDQEIKDGVQDILRTLTFKFRMQPALPVRRVDDQLSAIIARKMVEGEGV